MKKQNQIIVVLNTYFDRRTDVKFAYLFGSFGTQYQNKFSDLDIAVYVNELKNGFEYRNLEFKMEAELSQMLNDLKIDIRILNDAPLINVGKILTEGKLIFVSDQKFFDDYYELTLLKYLDYQIIYQPLLNYHYKTILYD
jgi:predicted nucleotidyltransferase